MLGGDSKQYSKKYLKKYVNAMTKIYNAYKNGEDGTNLNDSSDIMAGLGYYFKEAAYTVETDEMGQAISWNANKISVVGAILYCIFVFQSIFYFLAYLKRFFYIIILVIMAPVIVLLDFLRKAIV